MLLKIFYTLLIVAVLYTLGYGLFIWGLGRNFVRSSDDTRPTECKVHEANRISFYLKNKGFDLNRMLDSFKKVNEKYNLPDSSLLGLQNDCECCCIDDDKEIYFNNSPKEIYWIRTERYRFNAGFSNEYYNDIAYIDILSSFKNGNWQCSITSKLDSVDKKRVRKRINDLLSKMPLVRDTSSHQDEVL